LNKYSKKASISDLQIFYKFALRRSFVKLTPVLLGGVVLRLVVRPDGAGGYPGRENGDGKFFCTILLTDLKKVWYFFPRYLPESE